MYLTDIVNIAVTAGGKVDKFVTDEPIDVLGVNSRVELAEAHKQLQHRRNIDLMLHGVTMYHPETITVSIDSTIGGDTLLEPGVHISGGSCIDGSCTIGQGTIIQNCFIGEGVIIGPYSHLVGSTIQPSSVLAPYSKVSR
ncbi:MAG: hypothetical protein ACWGOX_06820 [Desulforhopalus sp.]